MVNIEEYGRKRKLSFRSTTWWNNPEDHHLYSHRRENLKFYVLWHFPEGNKEISVSTHVI
jgi:hypothetical protein